MADPGIRRTRLLILIAFAVTITGVSLFVWARAKRLAPTTHESSPPTHQEGTSPATSKAPSPVPSDPLSSAPPQSPAEVKTEPGASPESDQVPPEPKLPPSFVGSLKLIIPVAGVKPEQLRDTFTDSRSEGRVHDAIDIMAPAGTAVMAVTDGEIARLFQSDRGGTTIYQLNPDKKLVFYYAHLQGYAEGLAVGKYVRQGEVIAYVGDTGNAGPGNYHLHFSVAILADPKRYWEGQNINPYPLLRK